ncbi:Diencephalon/mesencephalon homeobox protein 1 [Trichinella papuae]|uniref:Diencephalon/mesencephalon homeobox protein 1 n=1 Tax=Trichinella papuae TaxID=268474 RepID=A0A0V1N2Z8_9BILA|nr:Diencephalon/mesencephalon homeobox protein 1 [Trichinella papuae]
MPTDLNGNLLQNSVPFSIWKLPDKEVNALPWFENLQKNSKIKRSRTVFTVQQLEVLERMFKISAYPSASFRENIKKFTNLSDTRIQVWFKNRRAKHRKKMRNIKPINSTEEFQSKNQSTGLMMTTWRPTFFEDISLFIKTSVTRDSRLLEEAKIRPAIFDITGDPKTEVADLAQSN